MRRLRSRWFPHPTLLLLLLVLLLLVLRLYPRLPHGLHARCNSRLLNFPCRRRNGWKSKGTDTLTVICRTSLTRFVSRDDGGRSLSHTHTCMFTHRVTTDYILFVICTHTHPHTQREGRVLSFGVALCL